MYRDFSPRRPGLPGLGHGAAAPHPGPAGAGARPAGGRRSGRPGAERPPTPWSRREVPRRKCPKRRACPTWAGPWTPWARCWWKRGPPRRRKGHASTPRSCSWNGAQTRLRNSEGVDVRFGFFQGSGELIVEAEAPGGPVELYQPLAFARVRPGELREELDRQLELCRQARPRRAHAGAGQPAGAPHRRGRAGAAVLLHLPLLGGGRLRAGGPVPTRAGECRASGWTGTRSPCSLEPYLEQSPSSAALGRGRLAAGPHAPD